MSIPVSDPKDREWVCVLCLTVVIRRSHVSLYPTLTILTTHPPTLHRRKSKSFLSTKLYRRLGGRGEGEEGDGESHQSSQTSTKRCWEWWRGKLEEKETPLNRICSGSVISWWNMIVKRQLRQFMIFKWIWLFEIHVITTVVVDYLLSFNFYELSKIYWT